MLGQKWVSFKPMHYLQQTTGERLILNKYQRKSMPPHEVMGLLAENIAASAADAVNLEKVEKKWWWKPLTKFLIITPFIALAVYYYS
jgi:hypothetical protein